MSALVQQEQGRRGPVNATSKFYKKVINSAEHFTALTIQDF